MSNAIVPSNLRELLASLKVTTELRDEYGMLLGYFEPAVYGEDWVPEGMTKEEFQRRLAEEPTGKTWADMRREFESLAQ